MKRALVALAVIASVSLSARAARAQFAGAADMRAIVEIEAPVFLLPDTTRQPLRILPAGTVLYFLQADGDWYNIQFNDRQFGRRTGFIERKYVRLLGQGNQPQASGMGRLQNRTAWVLLGLLNAGERTWKSVPTFTANQANGDHAKPIPERGDRLILAQRSALLIVDYQTQGEANNLVPPINRVLVSKDVAGELPAGTPVVVQDVAMGQDVNGLIAVWARITLE